MKKIALLAACALCMGQSAFAQSDNEITYVEDPSQGYLFNKFQDNWFITAEGGANIQWTRKDGARLTRDRFTPTAGLMVGKWFSPIVALRGGFTWLPVKGLSENANGQVASQGGLVYDEGTTPKKDGQFYKTYMSQVGGAFDAMINVTNWWCGYRPGRIYNFIAYAGGDILWGFQQKPGNGTEKGGYQSADSRVVGVRCGIINSFNVSKQLQIGLDIRFSAITNHPDSYLNGGYTAKDLSALLSVTYLFKKREWSAPVVPVCPEPENCDELRARLAAADGRIADLERQLRDALNRPVPEPVVEKAPLATIYYPINVYRLTRTDIGVLKAVADVMKSNPDQKYVVTGWADNYTGNDAINTRLRHNRANGVQKQLIRNGVPAEQLDVTINAGNLCDLGEKYVALDRAVTIEEAK